MPPKKKLTEKADKRLRKKITVGRDTEGRPIVKYASGKTKRELAIAEEELRRRYIGGQEVAREVSFEAYAEAWVKAYKLGKSSAGNDDNYRCALYRHIIPAFKDRQLRAITSFDLQLFMNSKAGFGRTTIGYIFTIIRNVFLRATAEGIIDRNPVLGITKPETTSKARRALTDKETAATLHVGETHPDGLLLLLLYYTGLRRGEAIGLQWRDIDFQASTISLHRDYDFKTESLGKLKTKAAKRTLPMPTELYKALDSVRGIGETFIFQHMIDGPISCLQAYRNTWEVLAEAMYQFDNSIESKNGQSILTAHYYRHNYASILYNGGVDILTAQKWLGHADAKTTLSIYSHLNYANELHNMHKLNSVFEKRLPKGCQNRNS